MDIYQTKKIMVVEDDMAMRQVVVEHLTMAGYNALEAEDGQRALDMLETEKPDLIILDLLLPKVDGFSVLKSIRGNHNASIANVPVIVFSNLWSNKDILSVEALHIEAYFIKTQVTMADVMQRIKQMFAEKKVEQK